MRKLIFPVVLVCGLLQAQITTIPVPTTIPVAFGQLYEDGAGTVINIATGGTFVKWVSSTVGLYSLTTPAADTDDITIDSGGAGTYLIAFVVSYVGSASEIFHWAVYVQGVKQDMASSEIKVGASAMMSQSGTGLVALSDADVVDLRVTSAGDTRTATINHAQLTLLRVGI